ncbi:MAG: GreA/GreB family elongation factor [Parcubacteria group bacterium]|nr:GreA/GreB family elongation factor [Parcubacteria group bacterium]
MVTSRKGMLLEGLLAQLKARRPSESTVIPDISAMDQEERQEQVRQRRDWQDRENVLNEQIGMLGNGNVPLGTAAVVGLGTIVSWRYTGGRLQVGFVLPTAGGEVLSDGTCVMTPNTPLGRALKGHQLGETVEVKTPAGLRKVEILSVE